MNTEQMRKDFEFWYSGGTYPRAVERSGEGYKLMAANTAWAAWQAALATQPQAPQGAVTEAPLIAQLESIAADSSLAHGDRLQRVISTIAAWRKS